MGTEDTAIDSVQLPFADKRNIPEWALKHVKAAFMNGWVNGRIVEGKTLLGADEKITREEAAAMTDRYLKNR